MIHELLLILTCKRSYFTQVNVGHQRKLTCKSYFVIKVLCFVGCCDPNQENFMTLCSYYTPLIYPVQKYFAPITLVGLIMFHEDTSGSKDRPNLTQNSILKSDCQLKEIDTMCPIDLFLALQFEKCPEVQLHIMRITNIKLDGKVNRNLWLITLTLSIWNKKGNLVKNTAIDFSLCSGPHLKFHGIRFFFLHKKLHYDLPQKTAQHS